LFTGVPGTTGSFTGAGPASTAAEPLLEDDEDALVPDDDPDPLELPDPPPELDELAALAGCC
jgi:hypothetical protein